MFDYQRLLYDALMRHGFMNNRPSPKSDDQFHRFYDNCLEDSKMHNNIIHPFKEKHLWVKKATGLGVTEFFLRLMARLCHRNNDYRNSQMVIVTGPNQDITIKLIMRMKGLFTNHGIYFDSKFVSVLLQDRGKKVVCNKLPHDLSHYFGRNNCGY
jgi:hypothetical protein